MSTTNDGNDGSDGGVSHGQNGDAGVELPREFAWPTAEWIAAYRREATPATMAAAARCAEFEIMNITLGVELTPEDLVQLVLVETLNGSVKWPAGRITLRAHLRDKVRKIGRRLRARASQAPERTPVSLDGLALDSPLWLDERLHAGGDVEAQHDIASVSRNVERELTMGLAGDAIALRVLAAMPDAITVAEIAAATGLEARTVRAAKMRIQRATMRLDRSLHESAREVLNLPPLTHDASALSSSQDSEP